ncbi:recombinase family protein [Dongshaea marina]|uniref:recombinase family protein n=1 Tax=Dongshaea marina TaxID=2047966 RepID=UPI000D3EA542|nr:recombinase family protein [Dongshaea marina]
MTTYIYARVSTTEQHVQQQADYLAERYSHDEIVTEEFSGKSMERPVFSKLIERLVEGDSLIVKEVSRLGRNTSEVSGLASDLKVRGVRLVVDQLGGIDVTSSSGKLILDVMAACAEMERTTMLERQRVGIERAKAEGRYKGRAPVASELVEMVLTMNSHGVKVPVICKQTGLGRSTVYRLIKQGLGSSRYGAQSSA